MLIGTSFSASLAQSVAKRTKSGLMKVKRSRFPSGELYYRLDYNRKPSFVNLLGSITQNPESLFELLALAQAAQANGIALKHVIIPYFGYGRQDSVYEKGEPVMAECVANLLTRIPATRFHFVSLHSKNVRSYLGPHDEIDALSLIKQSIPFEKYTTIVAPDNGASGRASALATPTQRVLILLKERRQKLKIIRHATKLPDLRGEQVLLVDDIIDTGKTALSAIQLLKKSGVKNVDIAAAHAVWSDEARFLLQEKTLGKIYLTNTLRAKKHPKMKIIDISGSLADILE